MNIFTNQSHIVTITLLNAGMPPFDMDAAKICAYVEQLGHIPESELREVIMFGLKYEWQELPTPNEIDRAWHEMFCPLDEVWQGLFAGSKLEELIGLAGAEPIAAK